MRSRLLIIGAGGAGLEALLVARRDAYTRWDVIGFMDDAAALHGTHHDGVPVLGDVASVCSRFAGQGVWFHCAIGRNAIRQKLALQAEFAGLPPATLVDASAVMAESAQIGAGTYIGPHAFVGPQARVGRHVLVNVGASVGHHAIVGDFAQLCPGARLSGMVKFGAQAFIGSNGVVAPGVNVGEGATIGAASFALREVLPAATVLGVPGKVLAMPPAPS